MPGLAVARPEYRNTRLARARRGETGIPVKRTAFTLTELMMAMAITSLIGLSVVSVAGVLSHAHSHTDSIVEAIQSGRLAMMRMDADIRKAGLITATNGDELAFWTGDANEDQQINVDEIVLIQATAAQTIERLQVVFPDSMSAELRDALNVPKSLAELADTDDVRDLLEEATYSAYLCRHVLAADVSSFEVVTDADPPMSRLVLMRLATGQATQQISLTNSARLRADKTGSIEWSEGVPVLNL